jgi:hypothetical protein
LPVQLRYAQTTPRERFGYYTRIPFLWSFLKQKVQLAEVRDSDVVEESLSPSGSLKGRALDTAADRRAAAKCVATWGDNAYVGEYERNQHSGCNPAE